MSLFTLNTFFILPHRGPEVNSACWFYLCRGYSDPQGQLQQHILYDHVNILNFPDFPQHCPSGSLHVCPLFTPDRFRVTGWLFIRRPLDHYRKTSVFTVVLLKPQGRLMLVITLYQGLSVMQSRTRFPFCPTPVSLRLELSASALLSDHSLCSHRSSPHHVILIETSVTGLNHTKKLIVKTSFAI